jgi:hypothetical protein
MVRIVNWEPVMDEEEAARRRLMSCAICGEPISPPATALLTVRAPSGRTGAFAAHGECVIGVFHPNARALLDAAPAIPEIE